MAKRALCVGINDYPYTEEDDLRGCVNDAQGWFALLRDHYDFAASDIKLITDKAATKKGVVSALKKLVASGKKGDVLVFTNASHGTNELDTGNDEPDGFDEALCPYDVDSNLITDDEVRDIFGGVKAGVRFYMISDSCHSGSITRAIPGRNTRFAKYRRSRYLSPETRGKEGVPNPATRAIQRRRKLVQSEESMTELLLSGCNARQSSYDDMFGTSFHGALSYYALETIKESKYKLTWSELHEAICTKLDDNAFDQSPQLEGKSASKNRQIFT
jgi:metacaspase-1